MWDNCLHIFLENFCNYLAEFSLFFVDRVLLMILLWRAIFQNLKITETWISWALFISKKILHTVLKIISAQISWKIFFFEKKFFSSTWNFFHDCKTSDLGLIFFHKKITLYFFFKCGYLISMQYYKHDLRIYLEKLWQTGDFTLLNKPLEPYKPP